MVNNTDIWTPWLSATYEAYSKEIWKLSPVASAIIFILSVLGILQGAVYVVLFLLFRDHAMIKAISVELSLLIIASLLVLMGSAFLWLDSTPNMGICTARLFIPTLSVTIALSTIGGKTYRIYRIFNQTTESPDKLSTREVLKRYVAPPVLFMLLVLGLLLIEVLVLSRLAYAVRKVPLALYTATISAFIAIPLIMICFALRVYDPTHILIASVLTIPPSFMLFFLFFPRLWNAWKGAEAREASTTLSDQIQRMQDKISSKNEQKVVRMKASEGQRALITEASYDYSGYKPGSLMNVSIPKSMQVQPNTVERSSKSMREEAKTTEHAREEALMNELSSVRGELKNLKQVLKGEIASKEKLEVIIVSFMENKLEKEADEKE